MAGWLSSRARSIGAWRSLQRRIRRAASLPDRVDTPYLLAVGVPGLILGLDSAAAFTPITVAATSGVPDSEQGLAAGLLNTTRQTSGAIGLAVLSTVASSITARAGGSSTPAALAIGYSAAFFVAAGCRVAAALIALFAVPEHG